MTTDSVGPGVEVGSSNSSLMHVLPPGSLACQETPSIISPGISWGQTTPPLDSISLSTACAGFPWGYWISPASYYTSRQRRSGNQPEEVALKILEACKNRMKPCQHLSLKRWPSLLVAAVLTLQRKHCSLCAERLHDQELQLIPRHIRRIGSAP